MFTLDIMHRVDFSVLNTLRHGANDRMTGVLINCLPDTLLRISKRPLFNDVSNVITWLRMR